MEFGCAVWNKKALHNKRVYRLKDDNDNTKRYKARLVVKGFQQQEDINFTDIFSSVVKLTAIRSVLCIVAIDDLHLEQLDAKIIFLHDDLEEDIYMMQPRRYIMLDKEHLICKLRKKFYGLKQTPRQWYLKFNIFMVSSRYTRLQDGHYYYFKYFENSYIILFWYVDDMLAAGSSMKQIVNLKAQLTRESQCSDWKYT